MSRIKRQIEKVKQITEDHAENGYFNAWTPEVRTKQAKSIEVFSPIPEEYILENSTGL